MPKLVELQGVDGVYLVFALPFLVFLRYVGIDGIHDFFQADIQGTVETCWSGVSPVKIEHPLIVGILIHQLRNLLVRDDFNVGVICAPPSRLCAVVGYRPVLNGNGVEHIDTVHTHQAEREDGAVTGKYFAPACRIVAEHTEKNIQIQCPAALQLLAREVEILDGRRRYNDVTVCVVGFPCEVVHVPDKAEIVALRPWVFSHEVRIAFQKHIVDVGKR